MKKRKRKSIKKERNINLDIKEEQPLLRNILEYNQDEIDEINKKEEKESLKETKIEEKKENASNLPLVEDIINPTKIGKIKTKTDNFCYARKGIRYTWKK